MSDTSPDVDITTVNANALSIAVPLSTSVTGDYLRLGRANGVDEAHLPLNPTDPDGRLVSSTYTMTAASGATSVTPETDTGKLIQASNTTQIAASIFADGLLSYSTSGIQLVAPYGYLRIGDYSEFEGTLKGDDTTITAGLNETDGDDSTRIGKGILIFSQENVHTIAPTARISSDAFTLYSSDSLSVTGGKSALVSAARSSGSSEWAVTTTFNRMSTYLAQLGSMVQAVTGNQVSQYLGNLSTCGVGTQFTGNYGFTQNAFGGQSVQIMNTDVEVTGWRSASTAAVFDQGAVGRLSLSCSPLLAAGQLTAKAATTLVGILAAIGTSIGAGIVDVVLPVRMLDDWHGANTDFDAIRGKMDDLSAEIYSIEALQLLAQVMVLAAGLVAKGLSDASVGSPFGSVTIVDGVGVTVKCGIGTLLVNPLGIQMDGLMIDATAPSIHMSGMVSFL